MFRMICRLCIALLCAGTGASALTIQLDYTYDMADGGNFFGTNSAAKSSLEAAAADLSAAITSSLGAVSKDTFTGKSGLAQVSFDWELSVTNPVTGARIDFDTFSALPDTITIFVGMRALSGSTLGTGGPGAGASLGISYSGSGSSLQTATQNAQTASDTVMTRGGGPVIGSLSGTIGTASYSLDYGAIFGNVWFDSDSNNDGFADSSSLLDSYWHFELTPPTLDGQNDFYSVALHELMHAIGLGSSDTWDSLRSGTDWLGANAIALNGGSGLNLLAPGGDHIQSGYMSPRLSDGMLQEVAMDPTLTQGTRKYLTQMDLAFLRDLNYATIPEPSAALLLGAGLALGLTSRRRSRSPAPCGERSCRRS